MQRKDLSNAAQGPFNCYLRAWLACFDPQCISQGLPNQRVLGHISAFDALCDFAADDLLSQYFFSDHFSVDIIIMPYNVLVTAV